MMMGRFVSIALALFAGMTSSAQAQPFPSKPITIIVPFAAGGPSDVLARTLGERMRATLNQTVVIENVTGAAGTIGVTRVTRSPADGYTISFGHLGTHVVNGAIYSLPFDLVNDLEPVAMLGANPMLVVSKNALPAKTLQELIAWVKANQDKATFGTAGVGSGAHFSGVYFQSLIGTKANYVPYRGTGPALQDLVAGQIDIIVDQASNSLPQVNAGTIRAYAVTDTRRIPSASGIPTVAEAGLPGFHVSLWSGLWAPKDTPKDVIGKLNDAVRAAFADAGVQKRYAELGLELPAAEPADARGAARASEGRGRKMVAGDQGGEHQAVTCRRSQSGNGAWHACGWRQRLQSQFWVSRRRKTRCGRRTIRTGRSPWWCRSRPAGRPTPSSAISASACGSRSASRCWSNMSPAPAARSAPRASTARRRTATPSSAATSARMPPTARSISFLMTW